MDEFDYNIVANHVNVIKNGITEIENLSSVGNILVYTDFDDVVSAMISYNQPMAAFAAIEWYD